MIWHHELNDGLHQQQLLCDLLETSKMIDGRVMTRMMVMSRSDISE